MIVAFRQVTNWRSISHLVTYLTVIWRDCYIENHWPLLSDKSSSNILLMPFGDLSKSNYNGHSTSTVEFSNNDHMKIIRWFDCNITWWHVTMQQSLYNGVTRQPPKSNNAPTKNIAFWFTISESDICDVTSSDCVSGVISVCHIFYLYSYQFLLTIHN